jgi:hypothetical protein
LSIASLAVAVQLPAEHVTLLVGAVEITRAAPAGETSTAAATGASTMAQRRMRVGDAMDFSLRFLRIIAVDWR